MNDLDDLKRALESPPGYAPRELDLDEIIRVGGRVRLRRRLVTGGAAAAAVVVLLVGGSQLIGTRDHPGRGTPVAPAAGPLVTGSTPAPTPTSTEAPQKPLGAVIRTGLMSKSDEWVFYAVAIDEAVLPNTHFGIMLGLRRPNGDIVSSTLINETGRSDRAAGFHQGEGPMVIDGRSTPAFGYFVGKPHRITAVVHGKTLAADLRALGDDPSLVVFWFDPVKAGPGSALSHLTAYDGLGHKLAATGAGFGVG